MSDNTSTAVLAAGYLLAVPFTVYVPGFYRMWRRREPLVFVAAETGAALIAVGWALKGNTGGAVFNAAWAAGFGAFYLLEGRKRTKVKGALTGR